MNTKKQLIDFAKANAGKKFLLTKFETGGYTKKVCVLTGNTNSNAFELKVLSTKFVDVVDLTDEGKKVLKVTTSDKQYESWTMLPAVDQISFNPDCNDFTLRFNGITLTFNFYEGN